MGTGGRARGRSAIVIAAKSIVLLLFVPFITFCFHRRHTEGGKERKIVFRKSGCFSNGSGNYGMAKGIGDLSLTKVNSCFSISTLRLTVALLHCMSRDF